MQRFPSATPLAALLLFALVAPGCGTTPTGTGSARLNPSTRSGFDLENARRDAIRRHLERHLRLAGGLALPLGLQAIPGAGEPVPIPGGPAPGIHIFAPGPIEAGLQGEDVEPSTITDYRGFTAIGYLFGEVTGSDGHQYEMLNDMRVYRGEYVSADGGHHIGTFGFI